MRSHLQRSVTRVIFILLVAHGLHPASDARAQTEEPVRIGQWLSITQADLGLRARRQVRSDGDVDASGLEHRVALGGQFQFDSTGQPRIAFGAYTGDGFASGWNSSGIGGPFSPGIYLKHLYLTVSVGPQVEIEYGSLYPIPGQTTAIVGYDNDGYLAGQRMRIMRPLRLFDEIVATYAHFGTTDPQQFTERIATLFQANLAQVFVKKEMAPRWTVAGDYTVGAGTHTLRLAVSGEKRMWMDALRVETYREMAAPSSFGVGVHARRSLGRLTVQGGYGDIDTGQALLSGTEFFDGRRVMFRRGFGSRAHSRVQCCGHELLQARDRSPRRAVSEPECCGTFWRGAVTTSAFRHRV